MLPNWTPPPVTASSRTESAGSPTSPRLQERKQLLIHTLRRMQRLAPERRRRAQQQAQLSPWSAQQQQAQLSPWSAQQQALWSAQQQALSQLAQ